MEAWMIQTRLIQCPVTQKTEMRYNMSGDIREETDGCPSRPDLTPSPSFHKDLRRGERVTVNLPVRIAGVGERGSEFLDEGRTVDISRHGATIVVPRELTVGQEIKVGQVGINRDTVARVVDRKASGREGLRYGIEFTEHDAHPWDIAFPEDPPHEAVLRTLLRCAACGFTELSYLNEFESDLFLSHYSVARLCSRCGGWTVWTRPWRHLMLAVGERAESSNGQHANSSSFIAPGSKNRRSRERVRAETVGCVRHPKRGNEVVVVSDLGRGGLRFYSSQKFDEGMTAEMAVPYSSKAPNVFLPVRVAASREKEGALTEYHAAYIF